MFVGDYEGLIPFSKDEAEAHISGVKKVLKEKKDYHPYTNFEIVLLKTVEGLLQENGQLGRCQQAAEETSKKLICENEQLRAQAARMREAVQKLFQINCQNCEACFPGNEKDCCALEVKNAALSDMPADYHNPADVAALKQAREAFTDCLSMCDSEGYDVAHDNYLEVIKQIEGVLNNV